MASHTFTKSGGTGRRDSVDIMLLVCRVISQVCVTKWFSNTIFGQKARNILFGT